MKKAIKEFTAEAERTIREVIDYSNQIIEKFKKAEAELTTDIKAALEELGRTVKENNPKLKSKYGPLLRDMTESPVNYCFSAHIRDFRNSPYHSGIPVLQFMQSQSIS